MREVLAVGPGFVQEDHTDRVPEPQALKEGLDQDQDQDQDPGPDPDPVLNQHRLSGCQTWASVSTTAGEAFQY